MNHLSFEKICSLAENLAGEGILSPEEEKDLMHIEECPACYKLLQEQIALESLLEQGIQEMDFSQALEEEEPVREKLSAVIRLVVHGAESLMEQLQQGLWSFDRPAIAGASRSAEGRTSGICRLEDRENSHSFVACDPGQGVLAIQLESPETEPEAWICCRDGQKEKLSFRKQGNLYSSLLQNLPAGEYELKLKK